MAQGLFVFSETSPASPGAAASAGPVSGNDPFSAAGICHPLDNYQALFIDATLVGATGGTLDVYVQNSPDQGLTWYDWVHFAQLAAAAPIVRYAFSASVSAQNLVLTPIGVGLVPALAANTALGGAWGDRLRLVMVAGSGTTAGAAVNVRINGIVPQVRRG